MKKTHMRACLSSKYIYVCLWDAVIRVVVVIIHIVITIIGNASEKTEFLSDLWKIKLWISRVFVKAFLFYSIC